MINAAELTKEEFYIVTDTDGETYEGILKGIYNSSDWDRTHDLIFALEHDTRYRDYKYRISTNDRRKIKINTKSIKEIEYIPNDIELAE